MARKSERLQEIFNEAGFTDYETRVMSILLKNKGSTAQEISEKSEVPYTKIYSVLNNLERKGYIESNLERPKKYKSLDPATLFDRIIENKRKEFETLKKNLKSKSRYLEEVYSNIELKDIPVWLCPSRRSILNDMLSTFSQAEDEIVIVACDVWKDFARSEDFLEVFKSLEDVGVKMVVPNEAEEDGKEKVKKLRDSGVEVRTIGKDKIFYSLKIVDKEKCGLPIKKDIDIRADKGLRIDNKLIASILYLYFDRLWEEAETPTFN